MTLLSELVVVAVALLRILLLVYSKCLRLFLPHAISTLFFACVTARVRHILRALHLTSYLTTDRRSHRRSTGNSAKTIIFSTFESAKGHIQNNKKIIPVDYSFS